MPRGKSIKPVLTSDVLESRVKEESDFFAENATIEKVLSKEEQILKELEELKAAIGSIKEVVDSITKNGLRFRQF
jgi:enoyl-[acyl-carrier-protein] reductase (NADH)